MDLEEAFLADMVAHPHDATPWLVFADWLEERGDPRGELVRLLRLCWDEPRKKAFKERHARLQELFASGVRLPLPRFTNSLGVEFVWVPPGQFWMGGGAGKVGPRKVAMTEPYWMGIYPVTQGQWRALMGNKPSGFSRAGEFDIADAFSDAELDWFPVENVSWDKIQEFIAGLNDREQEGGWLHRLPTEEQWEYACRSPVTCRADCAFSFHAGEPSNRLFHEQANFGTKRPSKVGSYPPNRLGIHDLHGNVYDWVRASRGLVSAVRGGSWQYGSSFCRAAEQHAENPASRACNRGFRLVRVSPGT
jgi:uncharacterized protein (TIGR02996 family)